VPGYICERGTNKTNMQEAIMDILKEQGFFFIRRSSDGTYIAVHNKTTYYGLYVDGAGVVRQK